MAEVERGASASAVAERHGVNVKTLKWWRSELRRELRAAPRILPVIVPPTRSSTGRIEVVVGAFIIRVEGDSDLELVVKLASRLRDAC